MIENILWLIQHIKIPNKLRVIPLLPHPEITTYTKLFAARKVVRLIKTFHSSRVSNQLIHFRMKDRNFILNEENWHYGTARKSSAWFKIFDWHCTQYSWFFFSPSSKYLLIFSIHVSTIYFWKNVIFNKH